MSTFLFTGIGNSGSVVIDFDSYRVVRVIWSSGVSEEVDLELPPMQVGGASKNSSFCIAIREVVLIDRNFEELVLSIAKPNQQVVYVNLEHLKWARCFDAA